MKAHVLIGWESRLRPGKEEKIDQISQDGGQHYRKNSPISQGALCRATQ